jgi:hypothetical protein
MSPHAMQKRKKKCRPTILPTWARESPDRP